MKAFTAYWSAPTSTSAVWWLDKSFLMLLAFDLWLVMPSHGGRYGVGEFNVAHFSWLDHLQPAPTPSLYVGLLLGLGVLAFCGTLASTPRWLRAVLFLGYTWSWAMSMLDSYQHHYLISLLLLSLIWVRPLSAEELRETREDPDPNSSAGYIMIATTCGIVYAFTAIAKLSPDWRSGDALQRLAGGKEAVRSLQQWLEMDAGDFWPFFAGTTISLQVVCAIAFMLAGQRERITNRYARLAIYLSGLAPLSFHLGAELLGLEIGWFSYYMIAITGVYFLPTALLQWLARPFAALARFGREFHEESTKAGWVLILVGGGLLPFFGQRVDLPGAFEVTLLISGGLVISAAVSAARKTSLGQIRLWSVVLIMGGAMMWLSIAQSDVRFDYYRFVGGDMRRRGQLERSLEAYILANRYAPLDCEALHDPALSPERRRCDRRREEAAVRERLENRR